MATRHLRVVALWGLAAAALALAGCGDDRPAPDRPTGQAADARLALSSPAFAPGASIPARFTCAGQRSAPPLSWSRPPAGTRELVLVMEDLDAPRGAVVHWVVLGLSPSARGLPAGTKPATLRSGQATSGRVGYEPPCPPPGDRAHRYVFTLYALRPRWAPSWGRRPAESGPRWPVRGRWPRAGFWAASHAPDRCRRRTTGCRGRAKMLAFAGMFSLRTAVLTGLCTVAGAAVAGAQSLAPPSSLPPVPLPASALPAAVPGAPTLPPPAVPGPSTGAGPSLALGVPWCGRLVRGTPLATGSGYFFTWDLTAGARPNPAWRRHGTGRLVSALRRVTAAHHRARAGRPRVGIADLSLPRGGPFGPSYGGLGHLSHQNGLDADVLYPRRDRLEAPPDLPAQIDRASAQELVDRFVATGAQQVFVGRGLGLRGPRGVVVPIAYHLDHMHVRLPPERPARAPRPCPWKPQ